MTSKTIFTLNARDNICLDVVKGYFQLDESVIHNVINGSFKEFESILKRKKIDYKDLKNGLIPRLDRKEIALVFDTKKIESSWYGYDVFSNIIPCFDKISCNSVFCGDFIGDDKFKERLFKEFSSAINLIRPLDYEHHSQFFVVYINNLSDKMVENFNARLKSFIPYVGYFDLTFSSFVKTHLSTILVQCFIKSKNIIISEHEDERDNDEGINFLGYPFEENGYTCKSIQSMYYCLFLSYKIEHRVFPGFESDTNFSINALTKSVQNISDFNLLIEEKKIQYLLKEKQGKLKKAGIINLNIKELELFVKEKINNNYIYNLSYLAEHNTIKFNLMVETKTKDTNEFVKLNVVLEYRPKDKKLRLITLF